MNIVRFCITNTCPDLFCPNCKQGLDIDEWLTEYGEPCVGDCEVHCSNCDTPFILNTKVTYIYTPRS